MENHLFASSIAFFSVFSNIFLESQNPCFVLPNEFGPADVGVSRPIFRILILASAGISSGSSSSSALNTEATVGFCTVVVFAVDFCHKKFLMQEAGFHNKNLCSKTKHQSQCECFTYRERA